MTTATSTTCNELPMEQQQQRRKKCHGNRKDQRFRRKCRARKIKPETIEKLLKKRKEKKNNKNNNNQLGNSARNSTTSVVSANDQHPIVTTTLSNSNQSNVQETVLPNQTSRTITAAAAAAAALNKRKRDISIPDLKSISMILSTLTSSIALLQSPTRSHPKKLKNTITSDTPFLSVPVTTDNISSNSSNSNTNTIHFDYRRPMYLKRSSKMLFQMLSKKLDYPFKQRTEQKFIYTRLNLLDRYYCLKVHLELWQSYLDIGIEKQKWPEQLRVIIETVDFEVCHQFLSNYIEEIAKQLYEYEIELTKQLDFYSITEMPFNDIDECLQEFVDCQRKYLSTRNNNQLKKYKDDIQESELFEIITTFYPSIDQNFYINQLIVIRQNQAEIWKEILQLDIRILDKILPNNFDQLQNFIMPFNYSWPVLNESNVIQFKHQQKQIIKEAKRQWLHVLYGLYEIQLQQYDQQYQQVFIQLEEFLINSSTTNTSSDEFDGVTLFNQIKQYMIYRTNQIQQEISIQVMPSFRRYLLQHRQRSLSTKNNNSNSNSNNTCNITTTTSSVSVSPEPYVDLISNPFNIRQWNYLALGPSLIRINQTSNRSKKQQNIIIAKEHKAIYERLVDCLKLNLHCIPRKVEIFQQYSNQLRQHLNRCYFTPTSYRDQLHVQEQEHTVNSIRKIIRKQQLILRVADKNNIFYIGSSKDFEHKVEKYFQDTNAFIELSDNPYNETLNKVIQLLNELCSKNLLTQKQHRIMMPNRSKVELAHLYFNPKTHKDGIPVRPIENTMFAITKKISDFLHEIISPIFISKCRQTTVIDSAQLIERLKRYVKRGHLKALTLFCSFDIRNLYTILPQEEALNVLMEFLYVHGYRKVAGISLNTIRKLASIVLKENVFVYGTKYYQQILGGAMGSSFTLTLANIFMWKWEKEFVSQQKNTHEIYCRYIDDIFITWNRSKKDLIELLDQANNKWHPNIKFEYKIGQNLPFLDVLLTNQNGILETSVYHKPTTEPYVIPFISDHPRHIFVNVIQTALIRAVKYSSTFEAFNNERHYIRLMLLYNGYPSKFIDSQFEKFFHEYMPSSSSSSPTFLPFITDAELFFLMHDKLLRKSTSQQAPQVPLNLTGAEIGQKNQINEELSRSSVSSSSSSPSSSLSEFEESKKMKRQNRKDSNVNKLIIHCTHEKRLKTLKRDMHEIYDDFFKNATTDDLKLIVGNRNRRSARHELIRKRPKKSLLKYIPQKSNSVRKNKNKTKDPDIE